MLVPMAMFLPMFYCIFDVYPKFFHAREITHKAKLQSDNPTLVSRTNKQIANARNNAKLSARQLGEPVQVTPAEESPEDPVQNIERDGTPALSFKLAPCDGIGCLTTDELVH